MNIINKSKLRTVPCFSDANYTIYEDGSIYSEYKNRFIKLTISKKNQVLFHKYGSVARIVWQSFHGELDRHTVVSFKDGDSTNVALSNLYVRTYSEMNTSNHANRGDAYPSILLDDEKITLLLENLRNNVNINLIAENLGCSYPHLRAILRGKSVKWFFAKYGPFDYYKGLRKEYEFTGKYKRVNKEETTKFIPYPHRHGSRKPSVIRNQFKSLKGKLTKKMSVLDIKGKFNTDVYTAVQLVRLVQS